MWSTFTGFGAKRKAGSVLSEEEGSMDLNLPRIPAESTAQNQTFAPFRRHAIGCAKEGTHDGSTMAVVAADHGLGQDARFDILMVFPGSCRVGKKRALLGNRRIFTQWSMGNPFGSHYVMQFSAIQNPGSQQAKLGLCLRATSAAGLVTCKNELRESGAHSSNSSR